MVVPAIALGCVVLYNSFYALNYRRLGNIAVWNNLQLALDALVVTILVYFSGGVNSWFWSMYALFILEAAFILPRWRMTWFHAIFSCVLLGLVEFTELFGLIPHVEIPFAGAAFHLDPVFVQVRYSWQVAVLLGTAWVVTLLVGEFRRELAARGSQTLVDEATGLYSRSYFMRAGAAEIRRAQREDRALHVMLIDLDAFGAFNAKFGIDVGDHMLRAVADAISDTVAETGELASSTNIVARFGGEEFVVFLAEDIRLKEAPSAASAVHLADQISRAITQASVGGAGVTASIGVASMPGDGASMGELLDHADAALVCAAEQGGHRVVLASDCPLVEDEYQTHEHEG